jgi:arginyl-tRNA synthetase
MIKQKIIKKIREALSAARQRGLLVYEGDVTPFLEIPRDAQNGDYSTNVAFMLAPKARKSPQFIAGALVENMDPWDICDKVEQAGKGFINFYIRDQVWQDALKEISEAGAQALYPDTGGGRKVVIEFVSANPTGPLHIGHGRGAVVGDVLANVLRAAGYEVLTEYYVNDAGKQIETLGASTYERWKELKGEESTYEEHFYQGDYVRDLAALLAETGVTVPAERREAVRLMSEFSASRIMDGIVKDLGEFGVIFDSYFRESSLYESGRVDAAIEDLRSRGFVYEKDGALWFKTSEFENDEDRVLVKSDGEKTYFASDIAYHREKFSRGFDTLIDIWGSDHHGYIPRMRASVAALGRDKEALKVLLIQFVTLLRDGKPVGMSTRSGEFTTLKEVVDEVGKDAARFFFMMRKSDAHLEFDLDLAKKTSNENPVYYVQYAHARIASVFRNAVEAGIDPAALDGARLDLLAVKDEIDMIKDILHFSDVIEGSARSLEPHRLTFYLLQLVGRFHSYYNKTRILVDDRELTRARLSLLKILQQVIRGGLAVLGVSAPEKM